ncbi:MAG TPA: hypothetical protein PKA82_00870 [Pyrinomonadaceae bacterium]|nr:hypothetical protein [Pyrinomonadaceae bacterium]
MNNVPLYPGVPVSATGTNQTNNGIRLLRLIRAAQPVTRTELAERRSGLLVEESTYVEAYKRRGRVVSFANSSLYVAGVNLGVRRTQVGVATPSSDVISEYDFKTPSTPASALREVRERIKAVIDKRSGVAPAVIGVSVPGMTDANREDLVYAPKP